MCIDDFIKDAIPLCSLFSNSRAVMAILFPFKKSYPLHLMFIIGILRLKISSYIC